MMDQLIVLIHLVSTWFMTGVIWVVQLAQYPLLGCTGTNSFSQYYSCYTRAISCVVPLPMISELVTGAFLLKIYSGSNQSTLSSVGFALIIIIWCSTFFLQVPQHQKLEKGFDAHAHKILVATNWIRTWLWTVRAILVLTFVVR